ncbi:MAG: hypothetical protein OEV92_05405 [Nitrospinota bacterium]|nr:hypothetical protein [Nitrospinota bacterium]
MSVEKLMAALEKEGALREEAIMEQARAEAKALVEVAEKKAAQMDHLIAELEEDHARKRKNASAAMARIHAQEASLQAGWQTARLAFQMTRRLYEDFMKSPEYAPFIAAMLAVARAKAGPLEKIMADPVTAKALGPVADVEVEVENGESMGFTLVGSGGRVRTCFNFHEALAGVWKDWAQEYYPLLFEERGNAG